MISDDPSTVPLRWRAILAALSRLPQGALSRAFGRLADAPIPRRLRPLVIGAFARAIGASVDEAERPPAEYASLNEFFVRRLRPGARRWPGDVAIVSSPVDGTIGALGVVADGRVVQAKGRHYSAAMLIGDEAEAARFDGGLFVTVYLSPRHYHRIHSPVDGEVPFVRHLPGWLLPVNAPAATHVAELFARNERLVCTIDGDCGRVAVVAVGAYNVGRISFDLDPLWGDPIDDEVRSVTNRRAAMAPETRRYEYPIPVDRGEEIMAFHLGSTVVLLFELERVELWPGLATGQELRLGDPIARPVADVEPLRPNRV